MRTFISALLCFLVGCTTKAQKNITIRGTIGSKADKIYLEFPGFNFIRPYYLDSAAVSGGKFSYTLKDTVYRIEPYWVKLYVRDSSGRLKNLQFFDFADSAGNQHVSAQFIFSRENFVIEPHAEHNEFLTVTATDDIQLSKRFEDRGFAPASSQADDPLYRASKINFLSALIRQHPDSWYLLNRLYSDRSRWTPAEMEDLLSNFHETVFSLYPKHYNKLLNYIAVRRSIDGNGAFRNLSLADSTGHSYSIVDSNNKLTLVVFWASWCVPCRQEIPALKSLYDRYRGQGFSITSVSIDENKAMWLNAVNKEQMPWRNLIVNDAATKDIYGVTSVPASFLVDRNGSVYEVDAREEQVFQKLMTRLSN